MTAPRVVVAFGSIAFDNCFYDREVDVLYLHNGSPSDAVDFDGSPEGHHTRYNATGDLVGITILNARWLLERDGAIVVTLSNRVLTERDLGGVLSAA